MNDRYTMDCSDIKELAEVASILSEGGYKFVGINKEYYISASGHVEVAKFRGVKICLDSGDLENYAKGIINKLNTFAYYKDKCYRLQFNYE
jgi:hypothetical protein